MRRTRLQIEREDPVVADELLGNVRYGRWSDTLRGSSFPTPWSQRVIRRRG